MLGIRISTRLGIGASPRITARALLKNPVVFRRTVKTPTIDWKPIKSSVTNLARAENQSKLPIFRRFILGLMIAMPVISFFLGCWQVKRLRWKVDLISRCEHLLAEPPLDGLPANIDPAAVKDFEFRRFKIRGHFDYSQELFLGPRMRNGEVGYLLITPFVRADGGKPILVERGWIRKEKVVPATRSTGYLSHLAVPQGEIEIEAMLRVMPAKSYLQYEHEEGTRLFHVPDVEAMARETGSLPVYAQMMYLLQDQPWKGPEETKNEEKSWNWKALWGDRGSNTESSTVHLSPEDATMEWQEFEFINQGVPLAAVPKVTFTNNHMQYLLTWFGVLIASTFLLAWSVYKRRGLLSADKLIAAKRKDMKKRM